MGYRYDHYCYGSGIPWIIPVVCYLQTDWKISIAVSKRNAKKAAGTTPIADNAGQESGEIFAAIGAALYEISDDNHDIENTVLTIRKVQRAYSPWSSKIYGLREMPKK